MQRRLSHLQLGQARPLHLDRRFVAVSLVGWFQMHSSDHHDDLIRKTFLDKTILENIILLINTYTEHAFLAVHFSLNFTPTILNILTVAHINTE